MVAFVIATMGLSITAFADDTYSVPTENNINWTIVANTSRTGTEQLNLCKGDILKYNVSFTPTTGSNVKFGLITPSGTFRYVSLSSCEAPSYCKKCGYHLHFDVTNPDGDYVQPLDFFPHISFT